MSLLKGNATLHRFLALAPWESEEALLQCLLPDRFAPFEDGSEEERIGWASWQNPLDPPKLEGLTVDGVATWVLRRDTRKVPAALLAAHTEKRISALMAEKDLAFVGKEARVALADEVKAELLCKVLPAMKCVTVQWHYKDGLLLADGAPEGLVGMLMKSLGMEVCPLGPLLLGNRLGQIPEQSLLALDPLDFSVKEAM